MPNPTTCWPSPEKFEFLRAEALHQLPERHVGAERDGAFGCATDANQNLSQFPNRSRTSASTASAASGFLMSISKVGVFLVSKPVPVTNGKFADHFRISSGDGLTFCQLTKTGRLPSTEIGGSPAQSIGCGAPAERGMRRCFFKIHVRQLRLIVLQFSGSLCRIHVGRLELTRSLTAAGLFRYPSSG